MIPVAKFRYSLQSILDIKMKMETQAKQEFSFAQNALSEEEHKLDVLHKRKREYEENAGALLMGTLKIRDIEDNKNAILCMDGYIAEQMKQVKLAEQKVMEARAKLTDVMKERKTQETLREKAFEEFMQEENRQEGKTVDELTSYTYGRKRQVKH